VLPKGAGFSGDGELFAAKKSCQLVDIDIVGAGKIQIGPDFSAQCAPRTSSEKQQRDRRPVLTLGKGLGVSNRLSLRKGRRLSENSMTRGAWYCPARGFLLGSAANLVVDVPGARKDALKHAKSSMETHVGPIYPGIAAISPLITTKATMRLML